MHKYFILAIIFLTIGRLSIGSTDGDAILKSDIEETISVEKTMEIINASSLEWVNILSHLEASHLASVVSNLLSEEIIFFVDIDTKKEFSNCLCQKEIWEGKVFKNIPDLETIQLVEQKLHFEHILTEDNRFPIHRIALEGLRISRESWKDIRGFISRVKVLEFHCVDLSEEILIDIGRFNRLESLIFKEVNIFQDDLLDTQQESSTQGSGVHSVMEEANKDDQCYLSLCFLYPLKDKLKRLEFILTELSSKNLEMLSEFNSLETLRLESIFFEDSDWLKHLPTSLSVLQMIFLDIPNIDLSNLIHLNLLKKLNLTGCQLTSIKPLKDKFYHLESLILTSAILDTIELNDLVSLYALNTLDLKYVRLTDWTFLKKIPASLKYISLAGSNVNADGVKLLLENDNLEICDLFGVQLSDWQVLDMIPPQLKVLVLNETNIDSKRIVEIKNKKKDLIIENYKEYDCDDISIGGTAEELSNSRRLFSFLDLDVGSSNYSDAYSPNCSSDVFMSDLGRGLKRNVSDEANEMEESIDLKHKTNFKRPRLVFPLEKESMNTASGMISSQKDLPDPAKSIAGRHHQVFQMGNNIQNNSSNIIVIDIDQNTSSLIQRTDKEFKKLLQEIDISNLIDVLVYLYENIEINLNKDLLLRRFIPVISNRTFWESKVFTDIDSIIKTLHYNKVFRCFYNFEIPIFHVKIFLDNTFVRDKIRFQEETLYSVASIQNLTTLKITLSEYHGDFRWVTHLSKNVTELSIRIIGHTSAKKENSSAFLNFEKLSELIFLEKLELSNVMLLDWSWLEKLGANIKTLIIKHPEYTLSLLPYNFENLTGLLRLYISGMSFDNDNWIATLNPNIKQFVYSSVCKNRDLRKNKLFELSNISRFKNLELLTLSNILIDSYDHMNQLPMSLKAIYLENVYIPFAFNLDLSNFENLLEFKLEGHYPDSWEWVQNLPPCFNKLYLGKFHPMIESCIYYRSKLFDKREIVCEYLEDDKVHHNKNSDILDDNILMESDKKKQAYLFIENCNLHQLIRKIGCYIKMVDREMYSVLLKNVFQLLEDPKTWTDKLVVFDFHGEYRQVSHLMDMVDLLKKSEVLEKDYCLGISNIDFQIYKRDYNKDDLSEYYSILLKLKNLKEINIVCDPTAFQDVQNLGIIREVSYFIQNLPKSVTVLNMFGELGDVTDEEYFPGLKVLNAFLGINHLTKINLSEIKLFPMPHVLLEMTTNVEKLDISKALISKDLISKLTKLYRLKHLVLNSSRCSDWLPFISFKNNLEKLDLSYTNINSTFISHLHEFTKLQCLSLRGVQLRDWEKLFHVPLSLNEINLESSNIDPEILKTIAMKYPKLNIIYDYSNNVISIDGADNRIIFDIFVGFNSNSETQSIIKNIDINAIKEFLGKQSLPNLIDFLENILRDESRLIDSDIEKRIIFILLTLKEVWEAKNIEDSHVKDKLKSLENMIKDKYHLDKNYRFAC